MNSTSTNAKPILFHLITGFNVGGAERMLSRVLPRLDRYHHVLVSLRGDGPMGEVYRQAGLTTEFLNMAHPLDLRAWWKFRDLVVRYRPAVLTTYLIHADLVGRIFGHLAGIPIIVSSLRASLRGYNTGGILRWVKLFDGWVTHHIAVSEEVRRFYVEDLHFRAETFTVVTNGLPVNEWTTTLAAETRDQLRQSIGLPPEAFIIGTVSQLRPEKAVDRLVAPVQRLRESTPPIHCLIIGDGKEEEKIRRQAQEAGVAERMHFLGNRKDVKEVLKLLDIFILPSLFEGMSNALLEAMAAGRTIMVTDTPENREVITPETGVLLDTGNADLMAQTISALQQDVHRRETLAATARRRFEEHFALEKKIEQLDRLYQSLITRT
ncbi:MAG: glycosyltransferase [Candidatus Kerfeldbacteria bacterium]|nr:glycosyltransferase [Candidatus Kerfeldbacteria bacterium]